MALDVSSVVVAVAAAVAGCVVDLVTVAAGAAAAACSRALGAITDVVVISTSAAAVRTTISRKLRLGFGVISSAFIGSIACKVQHRQTAMLPLPRGLIGLRYICAVRRPRSTATIIGGA
jgi:hypothetical protein